MRVSLGRVIVISIVLFGVSSRVHAVKRSRTEAFAPHACTVCLLDISDTDVADQKVLECPAGHKIDSECLAHQLHVNENLKLLNTQGLMCCGQSEEGGSCQHKFPLVEGMKFLEPADRLAFQTRLDRAAGQIASSAEESRVKQEVDRLKLGITESFLIRCPAEGCGAPFGMLEGCNAAQCSDPACSVLFCHLCLESQDTSLAAHLHARRHSGDFWEFRSGYSDRYHWIAARKKLKAVFESKVEDSIRERVLNETQSLLREKKMWPLPAGLTVEAWLQRVRANVDLAKEAKIELLQNEAIYRRQMKNRASEALLEAEIWKQGGVVLASLDVRDAVGRSGPVPSIAPCFEGHAGYLDVGPAFRELGPMYLTARGRFGGGILLWSGVASEEMSYQDAVNFCAGLHPGSRLPSQEDYWVLSHAMGGRDPENGDLRGYHRILIPSMIDRSFWSKSLDPDDPGFALTWSGNSAEISSSVLLAYKGVRCVW